MKGHKGARMGCKVGCWLHTAMVPYDGSPVKIPKLKMDYVFKKKCNVFVDTSEITITMTKISNQVKYTIMKKVKQEQKIQKKKEYKKDNKKTKKKRNAIKISVLNRKKSISQMKFEGVIEHVSSFSQLENRKDLNIVYTHEDKVNVDNEDHSDHLDDLDDLDDLDNLDNFSEHGNQNKRDSVSYAATLPLPIDLELDTTILLAPSPLKINFRNNKLTNTFETTTPPMPTTTTPTTTTTPPIPPATIPAMISPLVHARSPTRSRTLGPYTSEAYEMVSTTPLRSNNHHQTNNHPTSTTSTTAAATANTRNTTNLTQVWNSLQRSGPIDDDLWDLLSINLSQELQETTLKTANEIANAATEKAVAAKAAAVKKLEQQEQQEKLNAATNVIEVVVNLEDEFVAGGLGLSHQDKAKEMERVLLLHQHEHPKADTISEEEWLQKRFTKKTPPCKKSRMNKFKNPRKFTTTTRRNTFFSSVAPSISSADVRSTSHHHRTMPNNGVVAQKVMVAMKKLKERRKSRNDEGNDEGETKSTSFKSFQTKAKTKSKKESKSKSKPFVGSTRRGTIFRTTGSIPHRLQPKKKKKKETDHISNNKKFVHTTASLDERPSYIIEKLSNNMYLKMHQNGKCDLLRSKHSKSPISLDHLSGKEALWNFEHSKR